MTASALPLPAPPAVGDGTADPAIDDPLELERFTRRYVRAGG